MPRPTTDSPNDGLIDISVLLREGIPEWPGDTPYSCRWTWERTRGDSVNVSAISGSPHLGTHADAPRHVENDWAGAHELPLDAFIGASLLVDLRDRNGLLGALDLGLPAAGITGGRLLLRTGRSVAGGSFPREWPSLTEDCVRALLARGLRLLGVDAPSVDARESTSLEVHHLLFDHGACILENLDLRDVAPGEYELLAAPLRLEGLDAAPVRALLRRIPG